MPKDEKFKIAFNNLTHLSRLPLKLQIISNGNLCFHFYQSNTYASLKKTNTGITRVVTAATILHDWGGVGGPAGETHGGPASSPPPPVPRVYREQLLALAATSSGV